MQLKRVKQQAEGKPMEKECSSGDSLMTMDETRKLLAKHNLMVGQEIIEEGEFLR
jgi:hypothetical protein